MKGLFIEIKDLQKIYGIGYKWAYEKRKTLRTILNKKNITVREFCEYEGITEDEFIQKVNEKRFNVQLLANKI